MIAQLQAMPFVVCEGTPTVSFIAGEAQLMLPYHSFVSGLMNKSGIHLDFADYIVVIEGQYLDELWETLQLQDVRRISLSDQSHQQNGECLITRISVQQASKNESGEH